MNLLRLDEGEIRVLGLDSRRQEQEIKQRIGFVYDESYFYETLTMAEMTRIIAPFYKNWDGEAYAKYVDLFALPARKKLADFSKGMKMKYALAVALSHKAELLIMDEPTSGLDPLVRSEFLDILRDVIQDERCSVLLSSHITSDLDQIADYVTMINGGRIAFSKSKEEPMKINGIKDKKEQARRIRQVLEEVKLAPIEDFLPKFPHMLSGGQQQRLVIARAMILDPKMLVADEPVSMLDASVRVEILQLLQGLQRKHNLAIIYITHDLSTVRYFSERIFSMYGAKIIEKSGTAALLKEPLHPYTKALFEATSDPDAENLKTFKDVPAGEPPSLMNPPTGCRFNPRCRNMIKGLCDKEIPPEFQVREDHSVACWLYKDQEIK